MTTKEKAHKVKLTNNARICSSARVCVEQAKTNERTKAQDFESNEKTNQHPHQIKHESLRRSSEKERS